MFSVSDLYPFVAQVYCLAFVWQASRKLGLPLPETFTYDIEWNADLLEH